MFQCVFASSQLGQIGDIIQLVSAELHLVLSASTFALLSVICLSFVLHAAL